MKVSDLLLEVINSAKLTTDADKLLRDTFTATARRIADGIARDHDCENQKDEWGSTGDAYMRVMDKLDSNPDLLDGYLDEFVRLASEVMTGYIRGYIRTFPAGRSIGRYQAESFQVRFVYKENSTDDYADKYNGYFSSHGTAGFDEENPEAQVRGIKLFVRRKTWRTALRDAIRVEWFGDDFEQNGIDQMVDSVLGTLVHEISHLEQRSRQKRGQDFTHITATTPDDKRHVFKKAPPGTPWEKQEIALVGPSGRGKRGGYTRSPDKSVIDRFRYYGSVTELDSFAAGAATEIMREIRRDIRRYDSSPADTNRRIDDAKAALTWGEYHRLPQLSNYYDTIHRALATDQSWLPDPEAPEDAARGRWLDKPAGVHRTWDGKQYHDTAFKPADLKKVWNRFLKLVSQKLDQFKSDAAVTSKWTTQDTTNQEHQGWRGYHGIAPEMAAELRKRKSSAEQIRYLVDLAVGKAIPQIKSSLLRYQSPETVRGNIDQGYYIDWTLSNTVMSWFFADSYSPRAEAAEAAFKQAVARRLNRWLDHNPPDADQAAD
jgi:hypothetical protein